MSVSRSASRTRHVGVPVPNDPGQVIHSGLVAAAAYLLPTSIGGWTTAARRTQVFGKGLVNLHTTVVPMLCTALDVPSADQLHIHHNLRLDGADPRSAASRAGRLSALLQAHGVSAVRWWLARLGLTRRDADLALRDLPLLRRRELGTPPRARRASGSEGFGHFLEADLDAVDLARITRSVLVARADPALLDALAPETRRRFDAVASWLSGTEGYE
ncbi:class I tRNA ligase family protein [Curtobacterium flaccumfaciens]|uniref:class I tRNA ligase family protein n=1 Tax=Curtobacterium flaccumfaciens TaxID=2035 RepID=UPI00217DFC2E|nr:class I tRNA ligase family protein [Curtobacterium flaccumfaciens]MCS6590401.1 class I tRNA ligase family protein [Curtobacterium flaccumfaciens pv. flaccumfaciens]